MLYSDLRLPHRRERSARSDFAAFWLGETVSLFGSQVTTLALPLTAALTLGANAAQMGLLSAAQTSPAVLFGLFIGVWVDRVRRRPVLSRRQSCARPTHRLHPGCGPARRAGDAAALRRRLPLRYQYDLLRGRLSGLPAKLIVGRST